jgi:hypothetical protein
MSRSGRSTPEAIQVKATRGTFLGHDTKTKYHYVLFITPVLVTIRTFLCAEDLKLASSGMGFPIYSFSFILSI